MNRAISNTLMNSVNTQIKDKKTGVSRLGLRRIDVKFLTFEKVDKDILRVFEDIKNPMTFVGLEDKSHISTNGSEVLKS